jgi:hypothetical protein
MSGQRARALTRSALGSLLLSIVVAAQTVQPAQPDATTKAAIAKGVAYLKVEVPKWKAEHPCYSCHNNGDATRALLVAGSKGFDAGHALDDTLLFLSDPAKWDQNKAPASFDNKALARVQFAGALATAVRFDKAPLSSMAAAVKLLLGDQQSDGSWTLDKSQSIGAPVTYGTILATASARASLVASGREPDDFAVVQIDRYVRGLTPESVIDAAAALLALDQSDDVMASKLRATCLSIIRNGQAPSGGWGPYVTAPPQVFDSALAILALAGLESDPRLARSTYRPEELKDAIAKGRTYLASQQKGDGSWPETTRPADQQSYAQRISTTGWAMLALLGQ